MATMRRRRAMVVPRLAQPERPAERRADAALVGRTLELLDAEDRERAASVRRVGAHLLESYFAADEELARSKSPAKPRSYALLERRVVETEWSRRQLRDAVVVEICARSLPAAVAKALTADELGRLYAVDDVTERREIAARIARGELRGLPARELIARAAGALRRGGPRRRPPQEREVGALERSALRFAAAAAFRARELGRLGRPERDDLARRVREVIAKLRSIAVRLRTD